MNAIAHIEDAVFIQNDQVKTSSLKVAELFGKHHKNVIQKIETLDCSPEFTSANFSAHVQTIQAGAVQRESKYYEMTKDGFIFLVMGFTGAKAAQIKEAYINTFNHMAAMLYNTQGNHDQIHVGAVVQLKSGGPLYTVSKIIYDQNGYMESAEVIWHNKSNLCRETLPINCLTLESKNLIQNKTLEDFWASVHNYGIDKLNHSRKPNLLAFNLGQIYECIEGLPPKNQLSSILMQSRAPFPVYMQHNHAVHSGVTNKTVKCWVFDIKKHPLPALEKS
ncbi:phage-like protein [Acinetobacter baumannii]|uniref:Rha family transcriptional regulator n=1 Tax=Acinetobacter baumannii TaxID=470 RepID=UPI000DE6E6D1|nr:Rha family transcriptional regulator [Acinetobacter baumannii]SSP36717.1 phage-like protein [Acinetobacter baumannii]SSQ34132.1 phage-like protein [Acinetobacter baumannii]SSQ39484.1 phage-like protein [Acinetobacter baumannii]SVJ96332.1 phage-like protein [Acinetobacter baumannii]